MVTGLIERGRSRHRSHNGRLQRCRQPVTLVLCAAIVSAVSFTSTILRRDKVSTPYTIQHLKLVPQGDQFKLQCGTRPKPASERGNQRDQDGNHRHGDYPGKTRTSTAATRTG